MFELNCICIFYYRCISLNYYHHSFTNFLLISPPPPTIYHVYICIFWDVLRCLCTIVHSQVGVTPITLLLLLVQLNLTALVSESLKSATARYQTRTETQCAQLSLERSNKAHGAQALEISNDNLATTLRGRHFLPRSALR